MWVQARRDVPVSDLQQHCTTHSALPTYTRAPTPPSSPAHPHPPTHPRRPQNQLQVLAVAQLSVLELILLVAMQRLVASGKAEALNFEMVGARGKGGEWGWQGCNNWGAVPG